jgi:dTDP-4-dehydrorhamnose 3,5-epimerase
MSIKVLATSIPDVIVIEPKVFSDERGYFYESFNQKDFTNVTGLQATFVQDNHSSSKKGVLRGLHYQVKHLQGKLVRVVRGSIFDVAVDLRQSSSTFGCWIGVELSAENKRQLWIPEGFAHGFLTLSNQAEVLYKSTDYWHPASEQCIVWNDTTLNIDWPKITCDLVINSRDAEGLSWFDAPKFTF